MERPHHDTQAYQDRQNAGDAFDKRWRHNRHDMAALHEMALEREEKERAEKKQTEEPPPESA